MHLTDLSVYLLYYAQHYNFRIVQPQTLTDTFSQAFRKWKVICLHVLIKLLYIVHFDIVFRH